MQKGHARLGKGAASMPATGEPCPTSIRRCLTHAPAHPLTHMPRTRYRGPAVSHPGHLPCSESCPCWELPAAWPPAPQPTHPARVLPDSTQPEGGLLTSALAWGTGKLGKWSFRSVTQLLGSQRLRVKTSLNPEAPGLEVGSRRESRPCDMCPKARATGEDSDGKQQSYKKIVNALTH